MVILATILAVVWFCSGLGLKYFLEPYDYGQLTVNERAWTSFLIWCPVINSFLLYVMVKDEQARQCREQSLIAKE